MTKWQGCEFVWGKDFPELTSGTLGLRSRSNGLCKEADGNIRGDRANHRVMSRDPLFFAYFWNQSSYGSTNRFSSN
jgi:hypothetical protein